MLSNATRANNAAELVSAIRQQFKEGADFIKIYETGADTVANGRLSTPYQYTRSRTARRGPGSRARRQTRCGARHRRAWHALCRAAGVVSIDHANQLSDETMRIMRDKKNLRRSDLHNLRNTLPIMRRHPKRRHNRVACTSSTLSEFRKQLAAGVPMAVGSDVGPFPHGTQAREFEYMVQIRYDTARRLAGWNC